MVQLRGGLQGVADRLDTNAVLAEDERVNSVHGLGSLRHRVPLNEQDVTLEDLRRNFPLRIGEVLEQESEGLSDALFVSSVDFPRSKYLFTGGALRRGRRVG